jgi:ABC-type multidrug transport system, ATPase component
MVLLLGGSGAGKTTFVNAVNGYEKAKANIILNGSSIYDDYGKMKYKIGFVPQMDLMRGN